ncbi:GCN5-related N-acetyltransferase 6, chloroplastic-like isoform X2 [Aristolochia californica]|uniref:GCN5-related N-acetyltransferase 6, chloroplastic-like isoform X2 n=1 Tax=Aristolochia californica TaxID=171875 RepID=UPI0035DB5D66
MSTAVPRSSGIWSVLFHGGENRPRSWRLSVIMQNTSALNQKKQIYSEGLQVLSTPEPEFSCPSDLHFEKLQQSDQERVCRHKRVFGNFIAREASSDEEYWTAACLRAESHWEDQSNNRYMESFKRKFAEQEFNALKRRCGDQLADKCTCIVVVKKEEKSVKCTVLKNMVGTLDLSIHQMLHGETYPGEQVKVSLFFENYRMGADRYAYISNLCVTKYARRQGIAANMLHLAIEVAQSNGLKQIFVHVHGDNKPAQHLYQQKGFQGFGS